MRLSKNELSVRGTLDDEDFLRLTDNSNNSVQQFFSVFDGDNVTNLLNQSHWLGRYV